MNLIVLNGSVPEPAETTRQLLDLAHASLPTPELAGVLAGTVRAATRLLEPEPSATPPPAPAPAALSRPARAYLEAIETVLADAARGHGSRSQAAQALRRALHRHAEEVAARPRGAAVPPAPAPQALALAAFDG